MVVGSFLRAPFTKQQIKKRGNLGQKEQVIIHHD